MTERAPDDLLGWIRDVAQTHPDRVIVKDVVRNWTWQALLTRAGAYARALDGASTTIVPVFCGRTGDTIAAILGCLQSGRAFAPLAPDQPTERLRSCLTTLGAAHCISTLEGDLPAAVIDAGLNVVVPSLDSSSDLASSPALVPDAIAYVLFTSGSTGAPKGVMVGYNNLANTIAWSTDVLPWTPDDVTGLVVNFYFDISMFDVFAALRHNVPIAILSKPGVISEVMAEIARFRVTSIFSAPAFFSQFVRTQTMTDPTLASLRRLISGGDFFPPAHVLAWMDARPDVAILNVWGPTETSIVNTMHVVSEADRDALGQGRHAPVGRAHPRMPLVVVDEMLTPVPEGAPGEVCMLGPCVTQGYLGDPARTALAYVTIQGQRAYRTQDLGCLDETGNLRILGRLGSMTKVNGHRVDLGEVEGAVTVLPGVYQAAAFLREIEPGIQELWIAIEPADAAAPPDIFALKQALRGRVPAYMVPKRIVFVSVMPLTPNGKVDRKAVAATAVGPV
jgi:amino acid adenylation domain-containing protein